ncbi:hypothetical protein HYC85_029902 [Camellia sinensis]|uniref:Integrase catalytic domain-containing protein n=1 Tax=Camellia sinensis TaxID=4442 RepID=A0A7J7G0J9_CAMSI|nr:hypothetical protein HYC85_029902 [Camellia sinensis]
MYRDLGRQFRWRGMKKDVAVFVSKCLTCQQVKAEHQRPASLLQPLPIAEWKWEHVIMDFVVGLSRTQRGSDAIWVVVDQLTKSAHFIPMRVRDSVDHLADLYIRDIVRLHGVPVSIVSDTDPRFTARLWQSLQSALGTRLTFNTAYHPQTDRQSFRVAAVSPASGLPNPLLCLVSVCEPDSVFSVSFLEGRERSRRPSLNVRRLHFVAVGHFAHFGVRFPVSGAVRPCASVRDRLTISVSSDFWHTSYLHPFEGHWGLRNPLRGRMPFSLLNGQFSGPRNACFGPRAFVLHQFLFIFGRYLCFITRKVTEGWEASNCCRNQLSLLQSLPAPVFPTSGPMLNTLGTPCLPSAIPERFAGGLSCQGMTIRLTGCGLCQVRLYRNACISVLVLASGLRALTSIWESVLPEGINSPAEFWAEFGSLGTIASEGFEIPRTQQIVMAQGSEEFVAVIAALNQGTAMQVETSIETQRPSGPSASHPALGPQPNFDPLPPVEDSQCANPRERSTQAQVLAPLVQPNERLYSLDVNELDSTTVKITNLEKQFKKAQGLNSIPNIEDGHTEAAIRLPDRFKMPYIDRFDGSGDPMVHIRLFLDILKPMGLTKPQKLSLYGRTLSGVAATWYTKLEDKVKQNWEELAEAFVDQYSYNTQVEMTIQELEATRQNPTESLVEFVARWRAKAAQMTDRRPSERDQVQMMVRNLEHDMLQKLIVAPVFTFKSLHELGVQVENAFNSGIIPRTRELTKRVISGSTNAGSSAIPKPTEINTVATADLFAKPSLRPASPTQAQGRTFTPLYMSLTSALKVLMERGHLKPLDPQPLPDPLPARHNPAKYCMYHQQRGHGTDRCYRLRHEVQNLIDNRTIAPPSDPNDQISPAYLNLIHILPSTYDPNIYITPAHLPKPEVFIPESMDLCMMGAPEPQSSQTRGPTTSELMGMIKDLQRTVIDLASRTLAPSSTISHTREFVSKGSLVLEQAIFEERQSLGEVKASGKNKIGATMDPHEHLLLAVEALKAKGLNKEQVLTVVAKAVDDTFATQVGNSLNQRENREKGRYTRGNPVSSNPSLRKDQQTRPAPVNPFLGASSKNPRTQKYQPRGRRVFHALYMPLSKALQTLVEQGHLKPLEPRPLPNPLPATHDFTQYCAYHQQTGHATNNCFRLRHEVQDLFDNGVILPPSSAKSIGTGSVNLGDNVT